MSLSLSGFYAGLQHWVHHALAVSADAGYVSISSVIARAAWNGSPTGAAGKYRRNDELCSWKLPGNRAVMEVIVIVKPGIHWCQISAQVAAVSLSAGANTS